MHSHACASQVYSTCEVPITRVKRAYALVFRMSLMYASHVYLFTKVLHMYHMCFTKKIVVRLLSSLTMMTGSGDSES